MWIARGSLIVAATVAALSARALALDAAPKPPPAPELPPEVAWQQRLEQQMERGEMELTALDKKKPAPTTRLADRVKDANARVAALEKAAKLPVGTVRGTAVLLDLTSDIAAMQTRVRALIDTRKPKPKGAVPPTPKPPDPAPAAKPESPQSGATSWPTSLRFPAKARVLYEETGEWFISKNQRSGLGPDFLMNGYQGVLSLSISAAGLKAPVTSAQLLVVVQMQPPFADDADTYRLYEVSWDSTISSAGTFHNDSLKNLPAYADFSVSGPIEWISKPRKVTTTFPCTAHVMSVTLKSGEMVTFETPQFERKR